MVVIALAILALGIFKRKGGRKPPPIPEDATGRYYQPALPQAAPVAARRT